MQSCHLCFGSVLDSVVNKADPVVIDADLVVNEAAGSVDWAGCLASADGSILNW